MAGTATMIPDNVKNVWVGISHKSTTGGYIIFRPTYPKVEDRVETSGVWKFYDIIHQDIGWPHLAPKVLKSLKKAAESTGIIFK